MSFISLLSELFQLRLRQFEMRLKQDAGPKSPLSISLSSDFMDILFKENEDSEKLPIAVVRKSQRFAEDPLKKAVKISIILNMDETQQLQVKFTNQSHAGRRFWVKNVLFVPGWYRLEITNLLQKNSQNLGSYSIEATCLF